MSGPDEQKVLLAKMLHERQERQRYNKFGYMYPETGALRRELYAKHMEFFRLTKTESEVWFMAANRVGKSEGGGGYMTTVVATGRYPDWWPGRKWSRPVKILCAGTTGTKTRDSIQYKLLGEPHAPGTGLIPRDCILETSSKSGIPKGVDTAVIRHSSGGVSTIKFASFDQGRQAFEAVEYDFIWLDEEPPLDVYGEALIRTMTTHGLTLATFTPLEGISELILDAFPDGMVAEGKTGSKWVVTASWDDVPHLTPEAKDRLWAALPPHQREARSKGIPRLGSGVIYPIREDEYLVDPFEIPADWRIVYGMDVGWNKTAVVWGAYDPQGRLYLFDEHYQGAEQPAVHASAIRRRGGWIPGVIDPAARGRAQTDGTSLLVEYKKEGLQLHIANNSVEAGLLKCWQALSNGNIKVFRTMTNFMAEIRVYRRDDKGKVVKEKDHLMDAWRYLMMSGSYHAVRRPENWIPGVEYQARPDGGYAPPMVNYWR